jgi:uncharacterized membrane protein YphA (DoxX/SURF4 family)/CDGSH-type Zn-finger protein
MVMTLAPGRYSWCSCGYSKKQPFCDDSHRAEENATNRRSYKFEVLEEAEIPFCMCRHTGNPPYCDNTCKTLAAAGAATVPLAVAAPLPTLQQAAHSARAVVVQPTLGPLAAVLVLLGRIALAYLFISLGISLLSNIAMSQESIAALLPTVPEQFHGLIAMVGGVVVLLAGVMLLLGFAARLGALLVALFVFSMLFLSAQPGQMIFETAQFQVSMAVVGGLLAIMAFGAGPLSLDAMYRKKS